MAATLSDVLQEEHVTLDLAASDRTGVLREIIATMRRGMNSINADRLLGEVRAREELHTTYMADGVAFPHARTDLVQEIVLGIGRSRGGVAFGPARERAHLLFLIAVPRRMVNDYLVCVGALARVINNPETRNALMQTESKAEVVELIRAASLLLE
ncbi:MAG: PTS sugar transporter subunit IIA [Verrucomicrobiota bacterium]|nr:PTS sugar transporter subunit IIA [Verrucomicrobiota bacterium]